MPYRSVEFDAVAPEESAVVSTEGDFVVRQGKYFELGEYPDKGFALTAEEADAALELFSGAPINLEHMHTLLDGKLGFVQRIWRQGKELFAEYVIPSWLHRVTHGDPIKISSEWDRATKRPIGAALVLSPRIEDAVMMAAFKESFLQGFRLNSAEAQHDHTRYSNVHTPDTGGKESRPMSLLARFTAFLRGEGLITDEEVGASGEATAQPEAQACPPTSSLTFSATPEYRQMAAAIKEQETVIEQLRAQFAEEESRATSVQHLNAVMDLVRTGKLTAGEAEQWRSVAESYPAAFSAVLETLQARPPLVQFSQQNQAGKQRVVPDPEDAAGKLIALTRERARETGERYETAFSLVCRENPVLAAEHAGSQ